MSNHVYKIFFFILGAFQLTAFAEQNIFSMGYEANSTTDGLSAYVEKIYYRNHRRDFFFNYPDESKETIDHAVLVRANQASIQGYGSNTFLGSYTLGYIPNSEQRVDISLGYFQQQFNANQTYSALFPNVEYYQKFSENNFLTFNAFQSALTNEGMVTGPQREAITAWNFDARIIGYVRENVKITGRHLVKLVSDKNTRNQSEVSGMYAVSVYPIWFWMGIGGEYMTNTVQSSYWSPAVFKSYGPRGELNAPLSKGISFQLGLNYNKIQENNLDWGNGYYLSSGLQFGDRADSFAKIYLTQIKSEQSGSIWYSNSFNFDFNLSF